MIDGDSTLLPWLANVFEDVLKDPRVEELYNVVTTGSKDQKPDQEKAEAFMKAAQDKMRAMLQGTLTVKAKKAIKGKCRPLRISDEVFDFVQPVLRKKMIACKFAKKAFDAAI